MNTTLITGFMIGILLGVGIGYLITDYVTAPKVSELESTLANISNRYDHLNSEFTKMRLEKEAIEESLTQLQKEYEVLNFQHEETLRKQEELLNQIKILRDQYASLLNEYESSFGGIPVNPDSLSSLQGRYEFNYKGNTICMNITIPKTLFNYYASKERYTTSDYSVYVIHPYDDAYIRSIIHEFDLISTLSNYSKWQIHELVISFVQSLHYMTDDTMGYDEYPKFPLETLVSGEGDCEDTSILAASLLRAMNYSVALIQLPNHMALGIDIDADGKYYSIDEEKYYYVETTATGWNIGDIPDVYELENTTLYPVKDEAYLAVEWKATQTSNKVKVTVTFINEAAQRAIGYKGWVALESVEGDIIASKESAGFELGFSESKATSLTLTGPHDTKVRLMVGFVDAEGEIRNLSYSTYFMTD